MNSRSASIVGDREAGGSSSFAWCNRQWLSSQALTRRSSARLKLTVLDHNLLWSPESNGYPHHTTCRGCGGVPHLFSPPDNSPSSPLRVSVFSASPRYLFPVSFTSHELRITSLSRASRGHGFQTFRQRRILLHFSRCSRTKIGSVILSPS